MKLIAIETSGRHGSLCAWQGEAGRETLRREVTLPAERRSAQTLAPCLRQLLEELGWQANELDAVAVASGPGSFTGLRVGVTAAKMLAFVAGCGIVEVGTLEVLAAQAEEADRTVWAVLDAQRGEVFAAKSHDLTSVLLLPADRFLGRLQPGDVVTGPLVDKLELPEGVTAAPTECWTPGSQTVARLAAPRAAEGLFVTPEALAPRYHRLSAAEEKRLKHAN